MDVMEVLTGLLGECIAAAFLSVAKRNGLTVTAEHTSVGTALHFEGKDAPEYDILTKSLPTERRKCVGTLLDYMFPKRSVELTDFSELSKLMGGQDTIEGVEPQ